MSEYDQMNSLFDMFIMSFKDELRYAGKTNLNEERRDALEAIITDVEDRYAKRQ